MSAFLGMKAIDFAQYCLVFLLFLQFLLIMDKVFPKLTAQQFKSFLESFYYVCPDDETVTDNTKRHVQNRMKLFDDATGHTKADFTAVLVSDSYDALQQL